MTQKLLALVCIGLLAISMVIGPAGAVTSSPTASFTYAPSTPNPGDSITFDATASSDVDGNITDYEWYIGGESNPDAYGETFTKTFTEGGSHTIVLEVEDDDGNIDRHTETVTVENPAPDAAIEYSPSNPSPDETIHLTGSASADVDGRIVDYDWYVGADTDSFGYQENVALAFETAGTYEVRLVVEDNGGKTDTTTRTITVTNTKPNATFSFAPSDPNPDETITFDASESIDPDGRIVDYDWYIGTDSSPSGYDQSFTHSFDTAGVYDIRLVVEDNGGEETEFVRTVNVSNPAPEPTFTTRSSPNGLEVTFDASESMDPDGRIVDYDWDIGNDGSQDGSGQSYTHLFDERGAYEVCLSVTDNGETTREHCQTVGVSERPTAEIDYPGDAIPVNRSISLSAVDSVDPDGNISTYTWTLPDGTTVNGETAALSVPEPGTYTVTLTVTDGTENSHSITETLVAKEPPSLNVSWTPETPRDDLDTRFRVTASESIDTAAWDLDGDGSFDDANGTQVVHAFDDTGKQQVAVRVVAANGVATTTTDVLTVQQSATFQVSSVEQDVSTGETTVVRFSTSNLVRDTSMDAKLALDLPESGVSIMGVDGASLASAGETTFVTVPPGGEEQIEVRLQFTEPGTYDIDGSAIYYFGPETGTNADRRTASVDGVTVSVAGDTTTSAVDATDSPSEGPGTPTQSKDSGSLPGFTIAHGLGVIILTLVTLSYFVRHR